MCIYIYNNVPSICGFTNFFFGMEPNKICGTPTSDITFCHGEICWKILMIFDDFPTKTSIENGDVRLITKG